MTDSDTQPVGECPEDPAVRVDSVADKLRALADLLEASEGLDNIASAEASLAVSLQLIIDEIKCRTIPPEEATA